MITREIYLFVEDRACAVGVDLQRGRSMVSGSQGAESSWLADQDVVLTFVKGAQSE
jgi:hypothetical protein